MLRVDVGDVVVVVEKRARERKWKKRVDGRVRDLPARESRALTLITIHHSFHPLSWLRDTLSLSLP